MKPKVSKHYFSEGDGAYEINRGITIEEVKEIVKDRFLRVVIFNRLKNEDFINLEKYVFSKRQNVLLSWACKDFSPEPISLNFLRFLPSLKRLSLYGASQITDPDSIEFMKGLKELSLSKCESEVVDILKGMEAGLTSLSIAGVPKKKPFWIGFVSRFKKLKDLRIEGPCKGIEEIGKLTNLRELELRSVSLPNLDFLIGLNKLWSVDLKLGGIKDFSALYKLPGIKYLELWMVKGVSDVSFISKMTSLQNLHLESLINISQLPSFKNLKQLRRIRLMNLKGLKRLDQLKKASGLQDFIFTLIHQHQPEDLLPVLQNPQVNNLYVYFSSDKKNQAFKELAKKYGKRLSHMRDFVYK